MPKSRRITVALNTAVGTTEAIDFTDVVAARIHISGSTTSLTFHESYDDGTTYSAAWDDAATPAALTRTVATGRSYPIPDALFAAEKIKIVSDAAENAFLVIKEYSDI